MLAKRKYVSLSRLTIELSKYVSLSRLTIEFGNVSLERLTYRMSAWKG